MPIRMQSSLTNVQKFGVTQRNAHASRRVLCSAASGKVRLVEI